jgi:two-component system, probable response regulator PhcQ
VVKRKVHVVNHKVLIVDDDPNIITSLARLSKGESFKVIGAHSAEEALEMLLTGFYDVIVADENMPGMKGSDFLLRARELYPGIIRIMLTGNADLDLAVKLINHGDIYRLFSKPCDSRELLLSIRQALQYRDLLQKSYTLLQIARHQSKILSSIKNDDIDNDKVFILEPSREEKGKIEVGSLLEEIDDINRHFTKNE